MSDRTLNRSKSPNVKGSIEDSNVRSVFAMWKERQSRPSTSRNEFDNRAKFEKMSNNKKVDPSEWESKISSIKRFDGESDDESGAGSRFLTDVNLEDEVISPQRFYINTGQIISNGNSPISVQKPPPNLGNIIGHWKKETNKRDLSPVLNLSREKTNDIVGLKKLLLNSTNTNGTLTKFDKIPKSDSNNISILDTPENTSKITHRSALKMSSTVTNKMVSYARNTHKFNNDENTPKSTFNYNPYGIPQPSEVSSLENSIMQYGGSESSKTTGTLSKYFQNRIDEKSDEKVNSSESTPSRKLFRNRNQSMKKKLPVVMEDRENSSRAPRIPFTVFINLIKLFKRRLRQRYLKNRQEFYKFDPKVDPPMVKIKKRNKELIKKRDKYSAEDIQFHQKILQDIQDDSKMEWFDFSGYTSALSSKRSMQVPANTNDAQLGKITKSGYVQKITNKSRSYHQRWLMIRGFYLYWYKSGYSGEPQGVLPMPVLPVKEHYSEIARNQCITLEQVKGRDLTLVNDSDWRILLMNEIAFKAYMEHVRENKLPPKASIIAYFESENSRMLDLSQGSFESPQLNKIMYASLYFHPKLKELNLSNTQVKDKQLEELISVLMNLKKSTRLEVLSLDSNGITKDMMIHITKYIESENSFGLRKLSLCNNPLGDDGCQTFMESMLSRFDKMNNEIKITKVVLPFTDLYLSGTRLGDQSIFTLITLFDKINKKLGDTIIEDHLDMMGLRVADNMVSDNGIMALSKALTSFQGMKELDLSNNVRLTGNSFNNLLVHLKKSTSMTHLGYHKNALDEESLGDLFGNLADNFLLKKIGLTLNLRLIQTFIGSQDVMMDFYKIVPEDLDEVDIEE